MAGAVALTGVAAEVAASARPGHSLKARNAAQRRAQTPAPIDLNASPPPAAGQTDQGSSSSDSGSASSDAGSASSGSSSSSGDASSSSGDSSSASSDPSLQPPDQAPQASDSSGAAVSGGS